MFGTVFPPVEGLAITGSPGSATGAPRSTRSAIPVLAIGGVTVGNAGAVAGTGAAGIAAIGLFAACLDTGDHDGDWRGSWRACVARLTPPVRVT